MPQEVNFQEITCPPIPIENKCSSKINVLQNCATLMSVPFNVGECDSLINPFVSSYFEHHMGVHTCALVSYSP